MEYSTQQVQEAYKKDEHITPIREVIINQEVFKKKIEHMPTT
jgi:hypothetical protein